MTSGKQAAVRDASSAFILSFPNPLAIDRGTAEPYFRELPSLLNHGSRLNSSGECVSLETFSPLRSNEAEVA